MDTPPVPLLGVRVGKPAGRKGADSGRNYDGPRRKSVRVRDEREHAAVLFQTHDSLVEERRVVELRSLHAQLPDEVLGQHLREAGHVEDVFLGIQRGQLSTEIWK